MTSAFKSNAVRLSVDGKPPILLGNVGLDAKIRFLNAAWERVLGYDREELRNASLYDLIPLHRDAAVTMVKQVLDSVTPGPMAFCLRCKDGTHKEFLWFRHYNSEARTMFIAGRETTGPAQ